MSKRNTGTGVMLGVIILMVIIVATIFIVFFVNGGGKRVSLVNSNDVQTNTISNEVNSNSINNIANTNQIENEIDENNTNTEEKENTVNENEIIDEGNTVTEENSENSEEGQEEDDFTKYLGGYTWKNEYDTINFELTEENNEIHYRMAYYPTESAHASEELWGVWSKSPNIGSVDNANENAIATYSFSNIKYDENTIEMIIQSKDILNSELENYKIPDGRYVFEKD